MDEMRSFEHRVARELWMMAGPEPRIDALSVALSVAVRASAPRSSTRSGTLTVLAGGIVAAAVAAFLLLNTAPGALHDRDRSIIGGIVVGTTEPAPPHTATSVDRSPVPTTAPSPAPEETERFDWARLDLPRERGVRRWAVDSLPSGEILVLGRRRPEGRVHGWLSTDGRSWSRHPVGTAAEPLDGHVGLVVWDGRFVVAGTRTDETGTTGLVLTSPNGIDWTKTAQLDSAELEALEVTPDGLAIQGRTVADDVERERIAVLYTSPDARVWRTHRLDDTAVDPSLWVVEGTVARSDAGVSLLVAHREKSMLLRSVDDVEWTLIDLPAVRDSDPDVGALTWGPSGFVMALTGHGEPGFGAPDTSWLLHSHDGLTWGLVAETDRAVYSLAANDDHVLATPTFHEPPDGEVERLISADGRVWKAVAALDEPHLRGGTLTADGRILALIYRADSDTKAVGVLVGTPAEADLSRANE